MSSSKAICILFVVCAATGVSSRAQTLTTLYSFCSQSNCSDGSRPVSWLVQYTDGNFYGTTSRDADSNDCSQLGGGTVFKISPSGSLTTLYRFGDAGFEPPAGLTLGRDGNFYGTTTITCSGLGGGNVFKITPGGMLTFLHDFHERDGSTPFAGLVLGTDGSFYGVTAAGGTSNNCGGEGCGVVFKITSGGQLTTLYSFCPQSGCADGNEPYGGLVEGTDGNFYGTTLLGGITNSNCQTGCGTVFKITPSGALTTLYRFCSLANCSDGNGLFAGLVQGRDGNFYGTTQYGGTNNNCGTGEGCGTAFKITPSGVLTTIYNFCSLAGCADGDQPGAALIVGADGNLYGSTEYGGLGPGTLFKITPNGTLTTLHSFEGYPTEGAVPAAALMQVSDGDFYGTTYFGGASNYGTVFRFQALTLYALTVTTSGNGSVTSTDGLINCPGTCSHSYPDNAQVTLNATPAAGWAFMGWGGACSGTGSCQLTITQNTTVSATFYQLPVTLTASVVGSGTVTSTDGFINCPGTCQHTYNPNTPVTLNATPASGWAFSGWTGACIGIGSCNLTMTQNYSVTGVFIQPGPGQGFQLQATMPCRLVDTRQGSPIQGGSSENFVVPQLGGCNIPSNAIAYSLNVTVVPHRPLGYLTIWPTGEAQPLASLMNSQDARAKANAAIVPAGTNGAVSVYVTDTSDVILDIDGYFAAPGAQTLQFYPLTPCRVVDTRTGSNQPQGLGPPSLHDMETRELPILTTTCPGLPANPAAYSFNVTAVPYPAGQPENYVTLWPSDQPQPGVSTLNNYTATVVANAAIVPAASDGSIKVFAYNSTDLLIDINGYFAAPGQGGYSLYAVAPCRAYDSRNNNGQPFSGQRTVNIAGSPCAPPSSAQAYVFNATVVPTNGPMGYLTLWPDTEQQPVVSTLNAYDGFVTSNMAIVPNVNGSIDAYADGMTHLIMDISGYFAP